MDKNTINLKDKIPDVRYLKDIKSVVYDKNWLKNSPDFELYYMYRGLEEKNNLRYDITIIPAKMLGQEFVKTKGHYHVGKFQEVYIVLEGKAIYLMQKSFDAAQDKENEEKIEDVFAVKAEKGQAIIIPPFYGHVTINPAKEDLKMANWVSKDCKNDYSLYEKNQGACYYFILRRDSSSGQVLRRDSSSGQVLRRDSSSGQALPEWIKNNNYKNTPDLRFEKPLGSLPKNLDFLN